LPEDEKMKVVIQVAAGDDARAWELLQRHSPGVALPNRTYIVSDGAVAALRKSSIRFTEVSRDPQLFHQEGVTAGERI
jgi:hypothetical protein